MHPVFASFPEDVRCKVLAAFIATPGHGWSAQCENPANHIRTYCCPIGAALWLSGVPVYMISPFGEDLTGFGHADAKTVSEFVSQWDTMTRTKFFGFLTREQRLDFLAKALGFELVEKAEQ